MHRIGIIGLGSIGKRMLAAIVEHEGFCASVAYDPAPAACAAAKALHPTLRIAPDAAAVCVAENVDVVYVACPPSLHAEHAVAAATAGKAVLCEKPLGIDLAGSRGLVASIEASGVANAVNFLYCSAQAAETLTEAHRSGELGDLVWVEARAHLPSWHSRRTSEAPWLAQGEAGGFLREVMSHHVFLISRLLGTPVLSHAAVRRIGDAAEHHAVITLEAQGVPITITGTTLGAGPEVHHVTFRGSRATYRTRDLHWLDRFENDMWVEALPASVHGESGSERGGERDTHLRQLDNLACLLEGKPHTMANFREALKVQELIEAMHAVA
ncbi:MAG: Gfo/Idh/MocA family oxidoreductase [Chromatiales bacterium]|nr:Gfo/Idh/MocA family oxidoreductase [Chromatiales bacterium]